jgi:uncharacterized membrane protein YwaF
MADTHYLFWVMTGALTLLSIVVATFVGMARSPKQGFITFVLLFIVMMAGVLTLSQS